jgi:mannitol-1-/sugar-/sorbitol-6-/2-deoxyglucose-6-phosphatase
MSLSAAIFDVDGLLIDSEPLWHRTEVEVFAGLGIELTHEMCLEVTGLRVDEAVAHWLARTGRQVDDTAAVAERLVDAMVERVRAEGRALDGGAQAIAACHAMGLPVAVASSSPERLIDAALDRLGLGDVLPIRVSAQREPYGKPHPAVILTCAARLGVPPRRCLVFEDSLNGVIAAKAARAVCVAVPAAFEAHDPRFALADRVLGSLTEVDRPLLESLAGGPR